MSILPPSPTLQHASTSRLISAELRAVARSYGKVVLFALVAPLLPLVFIHQSPSDAPSMVGLFWTCNALPLLMAGYSLASEDTPLLISAGATRARISRLVLQSSVLLGLLSVAFFIPVKLLFGDAMPWYLVAIPALSGFFGLPTGICMSMAITRWGFKGGLGMAFLTFPAIQTVAIPLLSEPKLIGTPVSPMILIAPWGLVLLSCSLTWWTYRLRCNVATSPSL